MDDTYNEFLKPLAADSDTEEEEQPKLKQREGKKRHKELLNDVEKLSGSKKKRLKKNLASEPSTDVSEIHWTSGKAESKKIDVDDLVGCLQNTGATSSLKKSLESLSKNTEVLDAPLPKHEAEQVQRTIAYGETAERVSTWATTVHKNRNAQKLSFPMNAYEAPSVSTKTLAVTFKPRTSLEEEIAAVLNKSKPHLERKNKELTKYEEDALKQFDLEEAMQRRKELQKIRALQSYYEAKCKRIKKIKSKKFHRIQRKAEAKQSTVDLEQLAKTNPELLKSETEKAERLRALERANLRHRNTSKWAKNLIIKGKSKSEKDREAITEQLRLSRSLTDHKKGDSDNEESDDAESGNELVEQKLMSLTNTDGGNNPWLIDNKGSQENSNESQDEGRLRRLKPINNKEMEESSEEEGNEEVLNGNNSIMTKEKQNASITIKESQETIEGDESLASDQEYEGLEKPKEIKQTKINKEASPTPTATKKKKRKKSAKKELKSQMDTPSLEIEVDSDIIDSDNDDAVINEDHVMTIREAFANDDVISEFIKDKRETVEKDKPKDIDLTLPGWGEWGGKDLKVSAKKKRKFRIKGKPRKMRKDDHLANVIINEAQNPKFTKKQVSSVPFPYDDSNQFERSRRQPIGPNWNTPNSMNKMVQPRIERLMGVIIDPIKKTKSIKKEKISG